MKVVIRKKFGWSFYQKHSIKLWISGYFFDEKDVDGIFHDISIFLDNGNINIESLTIWMKGFSGHFAFVIQLSDNMCFASVDRICSIPIYTSNDCGQNAISNYAPYLKDIFKVSEKSTKAALEIAMSGFSIGNKTIYKNIQRLSAGECILWSDGNIYKDYYYTYYPNELFLYDKSQLDYSRATSVVGIESTRKEAIIANNNLNQSYQTAVAMSALMAIFSMYSGVDAAVTLPKY